MAGNGGFGVLCDFALKCIGRSVDRRYTSLVGRVPGTMKRQSKDRTMTTKTQTENEYCSSQTAQRLSKLTPEPARVDRWNEPMSDRYSFDLWLSPRKGWAQVGTGQDAWYFGTWANPFTLSIASYTEGDVVFRHCGTPEAFAAGLRHIRDWNEENGHVFSGIDCMCVPEIEARFSSLGLSGLTH